LRRNDTDVLEEIRRKKRGTGESFNHQKWMNLPSVPFYFLLAAMEECLIATAEAAAIVFESLGRHWWIAEARMALNVWSFSLIHIAPCGGESIVKTLPGNFRIFRRRRRLLIHRMWMRTSSQRKRQQQGCQG